MTPELTRREALGVAGGGLAAAALGSVGRPSSAVASETAAVPLGKAEHCVYIWLGGGSSQIDTWDPKRVGDPKDKKKPGSYYPAIDTAIPGVQVCEHLSKCAPILDRFNPIRTVHHDVIDEHAAATNRMHTGRPTTGTIVYPSIGSAIVHERGAAGESVPPYVLIGYPNVTRGPGFLGAGAGYVYLTDTRTGPAGLSRPEVISEKRWTRREKLLARIREDYTGRTGDSKFIADYDTSVAAALRLSGPEFVKVFELNQEPDSLRNEYGGEFGQRLLLTRRLLQSGTRFVEVSHNLNFVNGTGWDIHNDGYVNQHLLIQELDQAVATLVLDLERNKMLDKTLIVIASEFGRPAGFDGGGGRGHHGKAFSVVLAGGGLRTGQVIGETDELAMNAVSDPVSVPDLHATIYATLGIDPHTELFDGDRPVPITDGGTPIAKLFG